MKRILPLLILLAAGTAMVVWAAMAGDADDASAEGKRWWSRVQYLADDRLEGRKTGSAGHHQAAAYIAGELERAGFNPAGTSEYLQRMTFDVRQIDEEQSRLELIRDGKPAPLTLGDQVMISLRSGDAAVDIEAAAVFVGYGLTVPEAHHDDLAGLDLHGKIAVYLAGGPQSIPGPLKAHYSSTRERWKALQKAGAIGWANIMNPKSMDIPWERAALRRLQPAMSLADPALQDTRGVKLSLTVNPARADVLLGGTGHTMAEILAADKEDKPLPRFPLAASLRAHVALQRSQVESENVVGLLPGSDPALKDQCVVLTAHLDHLGVGPAIAGDTIYNGAMDDASGVASLLEVARTLHETKASLKRSVLLLAVTGEEEGLQGSKYFANHPTVDGNNIAADLNVDMFLPLHPLRFLEVEGLNESTLGDDIRAVAQGTGVEIQADKEPDRNLFIRSDQYSFIRNGVPALAFKFGTETGSPEEKLQKDWLKARYHAPSDDGNQPVDLVAAARFNRLLLQLLERVANAPARPQWNKDSFFRRFAH